MKPVKLTLVVHPFYGIKPHYRNDLEAEEGIKYAALSDSPFDLEQNPKGQLLKAGWNPASVSLIEETSQGYKKGIDFASNGYVLVLASPRFNKYLASEQDLFSYSQSAVPREHLFFSPEIGQKKYVEEDDQLDYGRQEVANLILKILEKESASSQDLNLYAFGEFYTECVLYESLEVQKRVGLGKSTILANLCKTRSVPKVPNPKVFPEDVSCQPRSMLEARTLMFKRHPDKEEARKHIFLMWV